MRSVLKLKLASTEMALERLLCKARQRGYKVTAFRAERGPDQRSFRIKLELESERPPEKLLKFLAKDLDVLEAEIVATPVLAVSRQPHLESLPQSALTQPVVAPQPTISEPAIFEEQHVTAA